MFLAPFPGLNKSFGLRIAGAKGWRFGFLDWFQYFQAILDHGFVYYALWILDFWWYLIILDFLIFYIFETGNFFFLLCVLLLYYSCIILKSSQLLVKGTFGWSGFNDAEGLQQPKIGGQIPVLWIVAPSSAKCGVYNILFYMLL